VPPATPPRLAVTNPSKPPSPLPPTRGVEPNAFQASLPFRGDLTTQRSSASRSAPALGASPARSSTEPKHGSVKLVKEAWENRAISRSIKAAPKQPIDTGAVKEDDFVIVDKHNGHAKEIEVVGIAIQDASGLKGTYTGAVTEGTETPNGFGEIKYTAEHGYKEYKGEWVAGRWEGNGQLINTGGDVYEGALLKGKREGQGLLKFTDGRVFEGIFNNDRMTKGTLSFPDHSRYYGVLKNGKRNGLGHNLYADGSTYDGEWTDNFFQGKGKMIWNDGGCYEGEWQKGLMHGQGTEFRANGTIRYEGQFVNGDVVR
jgi:hypothetical protein